MSCVGPCVQLGATPAASRTAVSLQLLQIDSASAAPMDGCTKGECWGGEGGIWGGAGPRRAPAEDDIAYPTGGVGQVKNSGGGGAVNEGRPPRPHPADLGQPDLHGIYTFFVAGISKFSQPRAVFDQLVKKSWRGCGAVRRQLLAAEPAVAVCRTSNRRSWLE